MIFRQTKGRNLLPSGLIMLMATYIVRLYRFKKNRPRTLMGVVEEVGIKGRKAFSNYDDLWDILNASKRVKSDREAGAGKKRGEEQRIK